MPRRKAPVLVLAAAYAAALAVLVFSPIGRGLNRLTVQMYGVWSYDLALPGRPLPEDFGFALNVLLFVPVGVLVMALLRCRWWTGALACIVLSAAIEVVQLAPGLDREFSLADVVANGIGGLLGVIGFSLAGLRRTRRAHGRMS